MKTEKEFQDLFEKKNKSFNWRTLEHVQTTVKHTESGYGKHFLIHFFAPINDTSDESARQEINFEYKSMPDELWML